MSLRSADPATLHEFIDAHWREWQDGVALDIPPGLGRPKRVLATYAELVRASFDLQERVEPFVRHECIAAVLLPRATVSAFAALLAIMRSGAAYSSIDPSFPDERVRDLLADSQAVAVVTDDDGARRLARLGFDANQTIVVDADPQGPASVASKAGPEGPARTRPPWLTPASLAYVIYTSGTTGRPKGVMIEHRAIANLVAGDISEFGLGPGDRVGQHSSHAYDSSVEEMWLAFAAGATLVVLDDDVARAGPDLLPWLKRERITVLCPPPTLLRTTGCRDAIGLLPGLRLVYVGGEPLTDDVVGVWAPGRRLVNGYGPTECAVVATRGDVVRGARVSIGQPVPNVSAWVLDGGLVEAGPGEAGELCVGGDGLARGYWNLPELTAQKFPVHPTLGRLYRTGDLARREADGTLVCLGRVDAQVKIRGYRVELEEIETRLAAAPGIRAAACRVQTDDGRHTLVAFVVPAGADAVPNPETLRAMLAQALPAYMVPSHIRILDALPATTGGTLDRGALPAVDLAAMSGDADAVTEPRTALESRVATALQHVLRWQAPPSIDAHFFQDLGGDSLLAAELITALRQFPDTAALTVRDAYEAPTIETLAARAATAAPAVAASPRDRSASGGKPVLVTVIQSAWLAAAMIATSALVYVAVFVLLPALSASAGLGATVLLIPAAALAGTLLYLPCSIAAAVIVKRVVIGTYAPIRAPVWSVFYARNWIVRQSLRLVPWRLIEGTVFQLAALRALGARIGRRVHIHRGVDLLQGGWDLLDIGDDVTMGQEAVIQLVDLEDEQVVVAPVTLGTGATVEVRASVGGGATIEHGGFLTALSSLPPGACIPAGQRWDGVPAAPAGPAPERPPIDSVANEWSPTTHGVAMVLTRLMSSLTVLALLSPAVAWLLSARGIDARALADWLRAPVWGNDLVWVAVIAGLVPAPLSVIAQLVMTRLLGPIRPGVISRWSSAYFRVWAKTDLVRKSGDWLGGTLMWPMWLRAAGMRIGKDCEISTVIDVVPELIEIGPSTFFADGVYLGGPRVHRGTVTLEPTRLGSGVFLGNHVVIPGGCVVPDGVLIGVCTAADERTMRPGSSWFGHPPFALSRPRQPPADRRLTHDPTAVRYINRWLWEIGRFAIPVAPVLILLASAQLFVRAAGQLPPIIMALGVAPALAVGTAAALCLLVLALKWLLLGRVRPGEHALWSCWCSRWDFHYTVWDRLAQPVLARLDGTLILAWYLRAMGMRIGKRVVLGPGFAQVVDPDMIQIDDDATVHALFQAHTFEDRLLKIDRIRVGKGATVGCGAVLFYGVDVGDGASVAPQSVIMKGERLAPGHTYEGCPSSRVHRVHDRSAAP